MANSKFSVGQAYSIDNDVAYYLGVIDGVNIFKLAVDTKLYCFYFDKKIKDKISEINKNKIEIYKPEQLPEKIEKIDGKTVEIDNVSFLKFIWTEKPKFPNAAFCPAGLTDELFERKGMIFDENANLELGKKYRAVFPDYCIINKSGIFRQTDMRERYPDIILRFEKFDKIKFLETSEFADLGAVYLSAKSAESYGGTHKEYDDWLPKVSGAFEEYFAGSTMARFKRSFKIKSGKESYFEKLGIDKNKICMLKLSL